MKVIYAKDAEDALFTVLCEAHRGHTLREESRNGPVISFPTPVTTVYKNPRRRVILDPDRDCNPFLHLFESLWMLGGRNDLEFMRQFTSNMDQFSDDSKVFNGAYGFRWRHHFAYDQLSEIVSLLGTDPTTRRAVLSMWDPRQDLTNQASKDLPCNTQIMFRIIDDKLDMTVLNRSNDAIWGAYGANVVHFSILQEWVACCLDLGVGTYYQVSNNLHIYPEIPVAAKMLGKAGGGSVNHYDYGMKEAPLLLDEREDPWQFHWDLNRFLDDANGDWEPQTVFFRSVALPMYRAWLRRKMEDPMPCRNSLLSMADCDWRRAAFLWINRRRIAGAREPILPL